VSRLRPVQKLLCCVACYRLRSISSVSLMGMLLSLLVLEVGLDFCESLVSAELEVISLKFGAK